jgi:hypothetical protein
MSREATFIRLYCEITCASESHARSTFVLHDAIALNSGNSEATYSPEAFNQRPARDSSRRAMAIPRRER